MYEEILVVGRRACRCARVLGRGQRPDQVRRRGADHRPERRVRRAARQRHPAGRRRHQQGRRHPRPEARARAGRRRVRSEAGRFRRQQVRRRRRQVRHRPLQLRRDDPGFRRLCGERHPVHHPVGDQPEGHRPQAVGRVPHLRPRRPAGHGVGRVRARPSQGQEDRRRPRQDDLRQGPRRRRARQHAQVRHSTRSCTKA